MKRWSILLLCIITLAAAQAATVRPDLEVTNFRWEYRGPGIDANHMNAHCAGTLVNNSQTRYKYVLIEISIIDSRTNEKLERVQQAILQNVAPGDKCQFLAKPPICVRMGTPRQPYKNPYIGRIDRIKGYPE